MKTRNWAIFLTGVIGKLRDNNFLGVQTIQKKGAAIPPPSIQGNCATIHPPLCRTPKLAGSGSLADRAFLHWTASHCCKLPKEITQPAFLSRNRDAAKQNEQNALCAKKVTETSNCWCCGARILRETVTRGGRITKSSSLLVQMPCRSVDSALEHHSIRCSDLMESWPCNDIILPTDP